MSNNTQLSLFEQSPFDRIRHTDEHGEYWLARELMILMDYTDWRNFKRAIKDAITATKKNGLKSENHIDLLASTSQSGKGRMRDIEDFRLSRYACYMIALNGDPSKPSVANAQMYFVTKARLQELAEEQKKLPPARQTKEYRRALDSGYTDEAAQGWVALDRQAKEARNQVTGEWIKRGGSIGKLTNFVTYLATGKRATDWKRDMNIAVSPRQYFSPMKKGAIAIIESFAALRHRENDSRGDAQLAHDIADMSEIINWDKLSEKYPDRDLKLPAPKAEQRKLGDGK